MATVDEGEELRLSIRELAENQGWSTSSDEVTRIPHVVFDDIAEDVVKRANDYLVLCNNARDPAVTSLSISIPHNLVGTKPSFVNLFSKEGVFEDVPVDDKAVAITIMNTINITDGSYISRSMHLSCFLIDWMVSLFNRATA